ncbi:hypothetical protein J5N97_012660 [Dioscorea zingiberensis]|uniref:NAC domain-containing protein n=1 Tax=Dioscorea zingiberensis TaxID=325984 RepID=A0A9D5CPQ4_9LILI|nr:hypothetical protein J5N97_012660 [Dioscorea zingiberensis]
MAITGVMTGDDTKDDYEQDLVMPGFRFHPTEEELVEFYLRRKVEGKKFNVELISSLDLYRFDPWELPALAAIGEKEWFFYVPRDRKYRNGDRPNRVTTSGYWKATGADRLIRNESAQMIGLKKTLVFYSGKAPKGVRTSWIMNEYRLPPPTDTDRHQKAEIALCKVYKRAGVEDKQQQQLKVEDDCSVVATPLPSLTQLMEHGGDLQQQQGKKIGLGSASSSSSMIIDTDEINRVLGYNRAHVHQHNHYLPLMQQPQLAPLSAVTPNSLAAISNKLWEWNSVQEIAKKYTGFKG